MDNEVKLLYAFKRGCQKEILQLLDGSINLHYIDSLGRTPLHWAVIYYCEYKNLDIIETLLCLRAPIDAADDILKTPICYAIELSYTDEMKVLTMLLKHVQNLQLTHPEKTIYLCLPLKVAVKSGNFPALKLLLQYGTRSDDRQLPIRGLPAYHLVSDIELLEWLGENGFDFNMSDRKGFSPLYFAVRTCRIDALKYLLQHGADPNIPDENDRLPLHYAIEFGCVEAVKLLIEGGTNLTYRNKEDISFIEEACVYNKIISLKLLIHNGGVDFILNDKRSIELLLSSTITVDARNILMMYLIELKCLGLGPVSDMLNCVISNSEELQEYILQCKEEISNMHEEISESYHFTVYRFLVKSINNSVSYYRNRELQSHLSQKDIRKEFPIYGPIIERQIILSKQHTNLIDKIEALLHIVFCENLHLDIEYIEDIRKFLSFAEMELILKKFEYTL